VLGGVGFAAARPFHRANSATRASVDPGSPQVERGGGGSGWSAGTVLLQEFLGPRKTTHLDCSGVAKGVGFTRGPAAPALPQKLGLLAGAACAAAGAGGEIAGDREIGESATKEESGGRGIGAGT
jgi:hypothetical protein